MPTSNKISGDFNQSTIKVKHSTINLYSSTIAGVRQHQTRARVVDISNCDEDGVDNDPLSHIEPPLQFETKINRNKNIGKGTDAKRKVNAGSYKIVNTSLNLEKMSKSGVFANYKNKSDNSVSIASSIAINPII